MKLPKNLPIPWILTILLGATVVGMAVGLAVTSHKLGQFTSRYELQGQEVICTAHEKTMEQLSQEIVSLKQTLAAQGDSTESKIKADLTGFLNACYNIHSENYRAEDVLEAVEAFVTEDCLQRMTVESDPHMEPIPSGTPTFAYQSSFSLDQFFVRLLDNGTARAIAIGDVSVVTRWGESTDTVLVQMDAQYDAEKGRWIVSTFTGMEGIMLSQITP